MSTTFGQELIASMKEAVAHASGRSTAAREHIVNVPDVRAIREGLGLSPHAFSRPYWLPLPSLQVAELFRPQPAAPATPHLSAPPPLPRPTPTAPPAG